MIVIIARPMNSPRRVIRKGLLLFNAHLVKNGMSPNFTFIETRGADDRHLIADNLGWFNVRLPFPLLI
jgi:hypothetical protein